MDVHAVDWVPIHWVPGGLGALVVALLDTWPGPAAEQVGVSHNATWVPRALKLAGSPGWAQVRTACCVYPGLTVVVGLGRELKLEQSMFMWHHWEMPCSAPVHQSIRACEPYAGHCVTRRRGKGTSRSGFGPADQGWVAVLTPHLRPGKVPCRGTCACMRAEC